MHGFAFVVLFLYATCKLFSFVPALFGCVLELRSNNNSSSPGIKTRASSDDRTRVETIFLNTKDHHFDAAAAAIEVSTSLSSANRLIVAAAESAAAWIASSSQCLLPSYLSRSNSLPLHCVRKAAKNRQLGSLLGCHCHQLNCNIILPICWHHEA